MSTLSLAFGIILRDGPLCGLLRMRSMGVWAVNGKPFNSGQPSC
jgi:hypothetical protein